MFLRRSSRLAKTIARPESDPAATVPEIETPAAARAVWCIERSVRIKGDLVADTDVAIDGEFAGSLTLVGNVLSTGPGSCVRADISASRVVIRGQVYGNVIAGDTVTIMETGCVHGDIRAPRITLREGSVVDGKVSTDSRPVPPVVAGPTRKPAPRVAEEPEAISRVIVTCCI